MEHASDVAVLGNTVAGLQYRRAVSLAAADVQVTRTDEPRDVQVFERQHGEVFELAAVRGASVGLRCVVVVGTNRASLSSPVQMPQQVLRCLENGCVHRVGKRVAWLHFASVSADLPAS